VTPTNAGGTVRLNARTVL